MSDEEKESSGLGFLLALGGAAAAIYTAYKVFMKPEVEEIELNNVGVIQVPIYYLAKALEKMSHCHIVYFAKGWENARGCKIEHEVALQYGLSIIYESLLTENPLKYS
jgi:hypothetical protein